MRITRNIAHVIRQIISMNHRYRLYKSYQTKFVDLIEMNNFENIRFFRISHIIVK